MYDRFLYVSITYFKHKVENYLLDIDSNILLNNMPTYIHTLVEYCDEFTLAVIKYLPVRN